MPSHTSAGSANDRHGAASAFQLAASTLPQPTANILSALLGGVREALGANLVALYLRGSLVMGDFDPAMSDVDFFAVTARPVSEAAFVALAAMHRRLARLPNPYGDQLEGPYMPRAAARRFRPGERHPTIGRGEALTWREHGANWALERWMVRERGVILFGPDPRTIFDPVSPGELRAAVFDRLPDWVEWAEQPHIPGPQLALAHLAYVVQTMCRALCTLATGELASKPRAVAWALGALPEPWRSTAERSRAWHSHDTIDLAVVSEVLAFVHWTAAQGEAAEGPRAAP